jgi:flagellar hook-length control protein FliK
MRLATPSNSQTKELAAMMTADKLGQGNAVWRTPLDVTATAAADVQAMTSSGTLSPMLGSRNLGGWMPLKATAPIDASDATNTGEVSSEAAIKDAMRLTITSPAQAVTQRLAQMSGSSEQSTWAALLAGNRPTTSALPGAKSWETLQLDVPDDLLMGPFDGSQDLPVDNSLASSTNQSAGQPAAGASAGRSDSTVSAPPNLSSQAEQRVIQQQQLADKLGQALAQRLVDQIERGQWKIEMRLRPESLGRIEVELKMHAGGLDALFSAENAVTRELISQGSGKLKDSLTQTGMTVADVSVSGDQNRQSGGNSTPGNSAKPAFGSAVRKPSSVESVSAAVKDEPAATDGLNVWA